MASPITSVPDPAEGGASTSADPLAGVITQVSPKQAAAPSRGGPARPTKVAKQGTAKATDAEKKRKKQQAAVSGQEGIVSREGGSEAKVSDKLEGSESAPLATATETEGSASHSQNPSSTLVGTTTTQPSTLTTSESGEGLTKDKPVDAKATPTEPAPTTNDSQRPTTTASQQDMTGAAQRLSTAPALSQPKGASGKEKIELAEKGQSAKVQNNSTSSNGKKQRKRPGLMAKIIAALTCSSTAAAIVEEEEDSTKKGTVSSQKGMNGRAGKVDSRKPAKGKVTPTPQSIGMERNTSSTATSPGGGTRLPREETGDVMSGAVVPPGSSFVPQDGDQKRGTSVLLGVGGSGTAALGGVAATQKVDDEAEEGDEEDEWTSEEQMHEDEDQTEEQRLIRQGGVGIPKDEHGNLLPLLAPLEMEINGRKCLVLDLDETLVHSSFKIISNADFIVPVEIEGTVHNVYVIKRPGVDEFMRQMGEIYEVVVFTASLAKYADPVLDILDIHGVVRHRLFRESCYNHRGNYVKDLSQLGREIHTSIIIDNSPASYIFHPNNAVPISSWFNDPHDTELTDLCPFLAELADVDDVRAVLDGGL